MGFIIGVFGGKGGVGKSVLAANLAVALYRESKQRVLLIDGDIKGSGDQSLITGIKGVKTFEDFPKIPIYPDAPSAQKDLGATGSGITLVGGFSEKFNESMDVGTIKKKINHLVSFFPLTVIDLGHEFNYFSTELLSLTSATVLVTTPDVLVINQTKRVVSEMIDNLYPQDAILLAVNKYDPNSIISPAMISKTIGRPAIAGVASEPQVSDLCINKSQLVITSQPNAQMVKGFFDIARKLLTPGVLEKLASFEKPAHWKSVAVQSVAPGSSTSSLISSNRPNLPSPNFKERSESEAWSSLKLEIHNELVEKADFQLDGSVDNMAPAKKAVIYEKTRKLIIDLINTKKVPDFMKGQTERARLVQEILDEALGLGPLEDLLADPDVKEIMVNGADKIYIEKKGRVTLTKSTFSSENQLMNAIKRIVLPLGRNVDRKTPYVDARLQDGSRVHAIIPPLALNGPTLTIRKFPAFKLTYKDLCEYGSMTEPIADFLRICIENKLNIVISGGTGSGKTTLLNVLSNFIPSSERIVTVEDAAELQLGQEHVVRLETRPKNAEGEGEVSIRDLVKQTLRMRPERIIVGECRDGAALDMLQAMNTGHDGSMTTVHSNSPRECINRLQTLCMMADSGMPLQAISEQIAGSIDIIIQQSRLEDGSRKVTHITEVAGMQGEKITLQDIFVYVEEGRDKKRNILGRFMATGNIPKFLEKVEGRGTRIPRTIFSNTPLPKKDPPSGGSSGTSPTDKKDPKKVA